MKDTLEIIARPYRPAAVVVAITVGALTSIALGAWALYDPSARVRALAVDTVGPRLDDHEHRLRAVEEAQRAMPAVARGVECLLRKTEGKPCAER